MDSGSRERLDLSPPPEATVPSLANLADIVTALSKFQEITLEETNKSAEMLKRIDNKYAVDKSSLFSLLEDLRAEFKILTIDDRCIFSYRSCYFDDDGQCFRDHQQGRRQRFKVRTRLYVESDRSYFEVKLKGKRGQTNKSRMKCQRFEDYAVAEEELRMLRNLYEETYGKAFAYHMAPALHVSYRRFTLVSARGGERITVDFNIGFETPGGKRAQIGENFIIVETKSADGRGKADQVLKRRRIRQARGCSKYCIGLVLAGEVEKFNKFRSIVRTVRSRMWLPDYSPRRRSVV